jgi:hypothetical protein
MIYGGHRAKGKHTGFSWKRYLSFNLKLMLIAMAVITFFKGEYTWFVGTLVAIFLSFTPAILKKDFNVDLPIILDFAITLSIFLHVIGGYLHFYYLIVFYDHITHFLTSATISLLGVTLLYILTYHFKILKLPAIGFGILTVFTTISMGVFWEFMEWGIDLLMGTNFQWGLQDTMMDLFFDAVAGIIVGTIATLRLRAGEFIIQKSLLDIGDVQNSIGYKRLKEMKSADRKIMRNLMKSFKDPELVNTMMEYMVSESKYLSEAQKCLWHDCKESTEKNKD